MRPILLVTLSLVILCPLISAPAQTNANNTFEVYVLSYGIFPDYSISNLVAGADKNRKVDLQMMIWLLKGPGGRNILVDTGCYHDKFVKGLGIKSFIKPSEALAKLRMKPEDITDVIISHMHWDHADGMDLFPNAKIWIQKDEYAYYTGAAWQPGGKSGGIDQDDVLTLVKLNMEHRVNLVDGDNQEIMDGIKVYTGGRHTFASQYVGVRGTSGTVVIASDNMYLYENLQKHVPVAQTFDADSNLKAQDRMKQIASRPDLIVPGHDPEVFKRFPKPGNGVALIQ
jgi:glyoxylase-like metal-dependent hydrolase (beta-lactamase superfamily II)